MFRRAIIQLGKSAPFSRSAVRNFSTSSFAAGTRISHSRKQALGLGLTIGSALAAGAYISNAQASEKIQLDAAGKKGAVDPNAVVKTTDANGIEQVQPPTNSPPFPAELKLNLQEKGLAQDYDLLGVGVRTVSFLNFHVYALGIYIARDDKQLAHDVLAGAVELDEKTHDLKTALLDPEQSTHIISHLLDHGVRLDIRIVPVRNTDFGHWRDAFVRQILAHPVFKQLNSMKDEAGLEVAAKLGEGINDLKVAFSRKITVPKHNVLHMIRTDEGALRLIYYAAKEESAENVEIMDLGTVANPNISKILLLQYLAGKNVSSESTRQNVVDSLAQL